MHQPARTSLLVVSVLAAWIACAWSPAVIAAEQDVRLQLDEERFRLVEPYRYDEARRFEAGWNRGADVAPVGGSVVAPVGGRVRFAGELFGRGVVTIEARLDGTPVVVTLTGLDEIHVARGDVVAPGDRVGDGRLVHVGAYDQARRSRYLPVTVAPSRSLAPAPRSSGSSDRASLSGVLVDRLARAVAGGGASHPVRTRSIRVAVPHTVGDLDAAAAPRSRGPRPAAPGNSRWPTATPPLTATAQLAVPPVGATAIVASSRFASPTVTGRPPRAGTVGCRRERCTHPSPDVTSTSATGVDRPIVNVGAGVGGHLTRLAIAGPVDGAPWPRAAARPGTVEEASVVSRTRRRMPAATSSGDATHPGRQATGRDETHTDLPDVDAHATDATVADLLATHDEPVARPARAGDRTSSLRQAAAIAAVVSLLVAGVRRRTTRRRRARTPRTAPMHRLPPIVLPERPRSTRPPDRVRASAAAQTPADAWHDLESGTSDDTARRAATPSPEHA